LWLGTACGVGCTAAIGLAAVQLRLPMWLWFSAFILSSFSTLGWQTYYLRRVLRLMRETGGKVCRTCAYQYGEIELPTCPECGTLREKDETKPLL
jgi:hypothetical protein